MNQKVRYRWLGVFLLLIKTSTLFAEKTPSDLFLTSSVHDNPFFVTASHNTADKAYLEKIKIRYLIEAIRRSSLTFIRNGDSHKGAEAAAHLLWKYSQTEARVKTARDFIEGVASQSMPSGNQYLLKLSENKTYPLRDVLYNELERLEQFSELK